MSAREIVSYDDLYSEEEHEQNRETAAAATKNKNRNRSRNKSRGRGEKPRQPVTIESNIDADDDSCTSQSQDESDGEGEHRGAAGGSAGDWDDTDLLRVWDSTIADYRREHAQLMSDAEFKAAQHREESRVGKWASVRDAEPAKRRRVEEATQMQQPDEKLEQDGGQYTSDTASWLPGSLAPPQSEEDALHRLSMAWYAAGYYAGYYQAFRSGIGGNSSGEPRTAAGQGTSWQQESDGIGNEHSE